MIHCFAHQRRLLRTALCARGSYAAHTCARSTSDLTTVSKSARAKEGCCEGARGLARTSTLQLARTRTPSSPTDHDTSSTPRPARCQASSLVACLATCQKTAGTRGREPLRGKSKKLIPTSTTDLDDALCLNRACACLYLTCARVVQTHSAIWKASTNCSSARFPAEEHRTCVCM